MQLPTHQCPPIQVAWPLTEAPSNDNDAVLLRDATTSQLLHAMARKFNGLSPDRRRLMGSLAMSVMDYLANGETGHG